MPVVPLYRQQVQDQGIPSARLPGSAPIEAFGGGQANQELGAASKAVNSFAEIYAKIEDEADKTAVTDAKSKLTAWGTSALYDQKNGAINRKGKNALGLPEELNDGYSKYAEEIKKELNDRQKAKLSVYEEDIRNDINKKIQVHVAGEMQSYQNEVDQNSIKISRDAGINSYGDPSSVQKSIASQAQSINEYAQRNGMPEEWVKEKVNEAASKTHVGAIERYLANGDDIGAKSRYEKVKDYISGEDKIQVEKALETGSLRGESQRVSDKIITQYNDLSAAREAVRQIKDPKLRDEVDSRVKMEFSLKDQAVEAANQENFMNAYKLIEANKNTDSIPPGQWNSLKPGQRNALYALEKQLNKQDPEKDDPSTLTKYYGMSPQALSKVSETQLLLDRPNLTNASFKQILGHWDSAKKGLAGNSTKMAQAQSVFSDKEMAVNALKSIGIFDQTDTVGEIHKNSAKSEYYTKFLEAADREIMSYQHSTGKPVSDEKKKQIMNSLVSQSKLVSIDKFGMDTNNFPIALLNDEQKKNAYVPFESIPPATAKQMLGIARAQGIISPSMTDAKAMIKLKDKIQKAYADGLINGPSRTRAANILAE